jgi:dTDP-4-amino-4,6-dideoxygalactose transaminase
MFLHSQKAAQTVLSLPIHPYMREEEVKQIIDAVREFFA